MNFFIQSCSATLDLLAFLLAEAFSDLGETGIRAWKISYAQSHPLGL